MTASNLTILISLIPTFIMAGMAFKKINARSIRLIGFTLAAVLGIIMSIYWHQHRHPNSWVTIGESKFTFPSYSLLVFILFLTLISYLIILVLQKAISKIQLDKQSIKPSNDE